MADIARAQAIAARLAAAQREREDNERKCALSRRMPPGLKAAVRPNPNPNTNPNPNPNTNPNTNTNPNKANPSHKPDPYPPR